MSTKEYGVVVAVGPDGVADGTLDLVTAEALLRGTGVELVHVLHSLVVVPAAEDRLQGLERSLTAVAHGVLTDASTRLRERLVGRQPVSTTVLSGPIAATLCSRGAEADVLVLERREPGTLERLLTMSISTRVAARAHVPVIVVPRSWQAAGASQLPVTVGVDQPTEAAGQVAPAAVYARTIGRPLVVLHAVWIAEPYQDMVFMNYRREEWVHDATAQVHKSLADGIGQELPDVSVDVRWVRPIDALVEATRESAVLVLCRRPDRHAVAAHLGSNTRAVLHHSHCPVMVADRS